MAIGQKIVSSSLLLVATNIVQRSLGLISTLILARLLLPEDFGIVAIAAISLHFATVLSNSGIQQYIPQKDSIDDEDVHTAWSIDLCMKSALWILLFSAAPLIGKFYDNTEIVGAIQVVSVVIFLRALQNPGLHILRRDLTYKRIFWLLVCQKILSFSFVITIALMTKSYWAIIVGDIVSALVGLVGSYILHPFRPRFSLKKRSEQWDFSKWMLAKGILGVVRSHLDTLMVSKLFSISQLGTYNVVRGISVLPATDIVVPSVEPLLSSFARVKHDRPALDHQFRTSILVVFLLITPICAMLAFFADIIVYVLLGEQWKNEGPLLASLSLLLFTFSLGSILGNFYVAIGKVKLIFFYNIISLTFIFSLLLLYGGDELAGFALFRGILGLISTSLWLLLALYFSGSHFPSFLLILLPPALISFGSAYMTEYLQVQTGSIYLDLIMLCVMFTVFYISLIVICYVLLFHRVKEWSHLQRLLFETVVRYKKQLS